jgi:hypothetical protein
LFLGYNTRPAAAGQTNQIVIGYNAIGLGSNSAVLGNTSITKTYLRGDVAIATTTQAARLDVAGGNVFIHDWNITSATPKAAVTREYLDSVLTALPSGISHYVTSTPVTYNGNQGGYSAVNAMCDALVTGSHVCTAEEILQTINSGNSASIPNSTTLWINNGPPGYTTNANDCIGWTNAASTSFAPVWVKLASGDGFGALERCNASRSYACCK